MKLHVKRNIIIGCAIMAAMPALWMPDVLQYRWLLVVLIVAALVDWRLIRCPKCGGNMGFWDRDICGRCRDADPEP